MWVSSSRRPLNSIELRHALATRLEDSDLDFDNLPPTRLVLRSCCGLIATDDPDNDLSEVRLVHHTLHQYLHTRQRTWMSHAHSMITQTCLTYLLFKSSSLPINDEEADRFTLKQFALEYWGYHAALCQVKAYFAPAIRLLTDIERLRAFYPEYVHFNGLHIAASFGLDGLVPTLLTSGYSVDDTDSTEETALHKASARDHPQTAEVLLKYGADPNLLGLTCTTPLFIAVRNRSQRVAKILLSKGARIDMPCEDLWTPLHKAADIGDLEMVKYLVQKGSRTNETSNRGLTALHRAAGRGYIDIMQFLLDKGAAKVDCTTQDGWTPLHGSASSGRFVAVSLLLNYGSDIHWAGRDGRTVLHRAAQSGNLETVEILMGRGAKADVMKADGAGDLPLHIAAREGYTEIINRLLAIKDLQQPQLSSVNERGWTPLQVAQLSGLYAPERCLQEHARYLCGDSSSSNKDVITEAIHADDADTVCQFLDTKDVVDIEFRDTQGRTLLHRAFHAGAYNTAAALLSRGADAHSRVTSDAATGGNNGWQAIHFAALSGNPRAVQLCLDHDADGNARTGRQKTPFHHACRSGNEDTVRLFLDQVLDPTVNIVKEEDDQSWTPLHFAAVGGHGALLCLLVYSRYFDAMSGPLNFWTHLQTCAAKAGRHEAMEIIRGFRYSAITGHSRTVRGMKAR